MRTNKTDINKPYGKLYHYDKPICIPLNVKYIALVSNTIYTIESLLDIGKATPLASLNYLSPYL